MPEKQDACEDCGATEDLYYGPCPYDSELHGDEREVILCRDCGQARAHEI